MELYNRDCIEELNDIITSKGCGWADICITSPPYKKKDGYTDILIGNIAYELYRALKHNSLCFINFGHLKEDKSRPFKVCNAFLRCGFKLADTIIWIKNHFAPLQGNNLNNLYEFIFMFYKGDKTPDLDRLSIGVPYKDKSNVKRFNDGLDLRCGGNIWYINIPTINKKDKRLHKDEFPIELPLRCLKLSGLKKGVVIDPFSGSATVGCAAKMLGLDYVGFETDKNHYKNSLKRLQNVGY